MIKTLIIIWAVISVLTLICEVIISKKILKDELFVEKIKSISSKETLKIIRDKKSWITVCFIPIVHIYVLFYMISFNICALTDCEELKHRLCKAVKEFSEERN